ncbi:MAG: response regulator [Gemmataceae bacterium]
MSRPVVTTSQRILVVDDNADGGRSLAMLLTCHGREVRVEVDGPAALQAVDEFQPDCIVLDIGLPGMDGFEIARRIRANPDCRVRLIAVSGFAAEGDGRSADFDHYFVKPVDIDNLLAIL